MSSLQERVGRVRYLAMIDPLIRLLAERHSQKDIAEILNSKGLFRSSGLMWNQVAVSRYFKVEGITSAGQFHKTKTQPDQGDISEGQHEIQQQQ